MKGTTQSSVLSPESRQKVKLDQQLALHSLHTLLFQQRQAAYQQGNSTMYLKRVSSRCTLSVRILTGVENGEFDP